MDLSTNWTLINEEFKISFANVTLPNSVHSILISNDYIDDPLVGYNDINFRWIAYADGWVLKKVFSLDSIAAARGAANLILDSVDTFASIYVNNKHVLDTSNQFVRYESINLVDILVVGENTIEVKFESSVKKAQELARQYPYRVPPISPPKVQHGEGQVNMIRKQQCSFSWDWGPAFAPIGINSPVLLRILDEKNPFDADFSVSVYPTSDAKWTLDLLAKVNQTADFSKNGTLNARIDELGYNQTVEFSIDGQNSSSRLKLVIGDEYKDKIKLWWPSGYGEQTLYELSISVTLASNNIILKPKRIGFRSVELIEDPVDYDPNNGLTFYFSINKQPIFFKGSNWIPADSFQENITPYKLRWLLKSAVLAHMNVLRVWGGGIYEKDEFYDICDELGIMVWQDFMFACGAYPTNKEFLESVESEAKYQVNRLKHHASVIVWAGNNENEAAISTNWYNTDTDRQRYLDDYRELYIGKIKPIVEIEDPQSRPFLASSPTNGKGSIKENWIAKNPADVKYGDMHFYDYKMNGWLPESYPIPRLMSEYGVQSMPSYAALEEVYIMPRDADFHGKLNDHREHHENGLKEIQDEIENNLKVPSDDKSIEPIEKFKAMIYLSQVNQAMYYKTAIELFRLWRDKYDAKTGQGRCMGSMYWQFNDLWHAPTWSTIEYHKKAGKWKMAHYYAKEAYTPLIIAPVLNKSAQSIDIHAISDLGTKSSGRFDLSIHSFESLTPRLSQSIEYSVEAFGSALVHSIGFDELEKSTGCRIASSDRSGIVSIDGGASFLLLNNKLAEVTNLPTANLNIESVRVGDEKGSFSIRLTTDNVALFVWLDINTTSFHGIFSQNGFHMISPQHIVCFKTDCEYVTVDLLKRHLTVQTLANLYD